MFLRQGSSRGDGTVPTGPDRKGSVIRGDVFLVDEDTDLLDPVYQNGGKVNPQWKPSRNGLQKGKPEVSSKHLDENITTEKKTDSSGRSSPLFPGKPSDDIIDLDTPKKPSVGFPKVSSDPTTSTDWNKLKEETDAQTRTVSPTSHVMTSGSFPKKIVEDTTQNTTHFDDKVEYNSKKPDKKHSGIVTIVSRNGDLVRGSDGKLYQLHSGPPGEMGPPGLEVSGLMVLLLLKWPCLNASVYKVCKK